MITKTATVSKNRQIAIPVLFGIQPGEKVKISIDSDNQIVTIQKLPDPVEELFGIAKYLDYSSKDFLQEKKQNSKKRNYKLKSK